MESGGEKVDKEQKRIDRADHFHTVDQTSNPNFFIQFLDEGNRLETAQACKSIMSSLLNVQQGQYVLDLGCGTGDDVRSLAQLVGNTGRAVGVDNSEYMIREARNRSDRGPNVPVEFYVGDAHRLDFIDNNTFDCSRVERLLMHLDNPSKAIAEMVRVTKPGGRIVTVDLDWDGLIINHNDRDLTRKVVHLMCDSNRNGWIGRQLPSFFKERGLKNVNIVAHSLVAHYSFFIKVCDGIMKSGQKTSTLTQEEYTRMWGYLERTNRNGTFLAAFPGFIVSGQKL
jgi:ubiquinone/menaquinone biosynthesis C-methylase UbiE